MSNVHYTKVCLPIFLHIVPLHPHFTREGWTEWTVESSKQLRRWGSGFKGLIVSGEKINFALSARDTFTFLLALRLHLSSLSHSFNPCLLLKARKKFKAHVLLRQLELATPLPFCHRCRLHWVVHLESPKTTDAFQTAWFISRDTRKRISNQMDVLFMPHWILFGTNAELGKYDHRSL